MAEVRMSPGMSEHIALMDELAGVKHPSGAEVAQKLFGAAITEDEAAYGLLWRMHTTDQAIHAGRRALRDKIGKDGQRRGITWARETFGETAMPMLDDMP